MFDFYNFVLVLVDVGFMLIEVMVIMVLELLGYCVVCNFGVVCGFIVCL